MKLILAFAVAFSLLIFIHLREGEQAVNAHFELSQEVFKTQNLKPLLASGDGKWANYLAMNIAFAPVDKLRLQIEEFARVKLKSRGEAHITVITPPEYWSVLRKHLSIKEIHRLAVESEIQKANFTSICIGRGDIDAGEGADSKKEDPVSKKSSISKHTGGEAARSLSTFYVVVKSEDLLRLRKKIHQEFVRRGGEEGQFKPRDYYPHITIGFTQRDLHFSDGVIKDLHSCWHPLEMK